MRRGAKCPRCLRGFCGEIPAKIVYQDEHCFAFEDINPQAPVHVLIVPREEIAGVADAPESGDHQFLLNAARKIAEQMGLESGFRLVISKAWTPGKRSITCTSTCWRVGRFRGLQAKDLAA